MGNQGPFVLNFAAGATLEVRGPRGVVDVEFVTVEVAVAGGASPTFSVHMGPGGAGTPVTSSMIDLLTDAPLTGSTAGYRVGYEAPTKRRIDFGSESIYVTPRSFTGIVSVTIRGETLAATEADSPSVYRVPPEGQTNRARDAEGRPLARR